MSSDDRGNRQELYDIYLLLACKTAPAISEEYAPVPVQVMAQSPGILYSGLPLTAARRYLKAIRDVGGRGVLASVRYRHPGISPEEGRARAREEVEQRRLPRQDYDPVEFVRDEGAYWLYRAVRREPLVEPQRIPGTMYLYIDKVDGHVGALKDVEEWSNLSVLTDTR